MNLFEQYNPKQLAAMTIEDIKKHRKLRNGEAITYANRTMAKYLRNKKKQVRYLMYVKGCSLGDKYRHLQTGHVWEVVEYNGEPVFIDTEYGDISEYIDEDFFEKLN